MTEIRHYMTFDSIHTAWHRSNVEMFFSSTIRWHWDISGGDSLIFISLSTSTTCHHCLLHTLSVEACSFR